MHPVRISVNNNSAVVLISKLLCLHWTFQILLFTGLLLAVGIILYISAINDETGYKSKSKGADTYVFRYDYGWSFYFAGLGFLTAEITAVVCISLYLKRNSEVASMVRIIPGLDQKIKDGAKDITDGICNPTVIL